MREDETKKRATGKEKENMQLDSSISFPQKETAALLPPKELDS